MERNLLIVDDELEIVGWLEELFRYEFDRDIGVYTARSGNAALELLNQIKFDVVLTDIHMPRMDGITLFHKVKENWPRCKTVFLTGYQNFDDVYKVFRHRDVRYVLKSERDETIMKAVSEAFDDIEKELENERIQQIQNEKLEHAAIWLRKSFMQDVLMGRVIKNQLDRAADELGIPLDSTREFLVFLLRIDDEIENGWRENYPVPTDYLASVLIGNLPDSLLTYVHVQENRYIFLFLQPSDREAADWSRIKVVGQGAVEDAQEMFRRTYDMTFSTVIKGTPVMLSGLSDAAARMKQIMVGYVGKKHEMILQEEAMEREEVRVPGQNVIGQIPQLKSYLELGKQKEYFDLLMECTLAMKGKSAHDIYAMEVYYSVATMILQFINANDIYRQLAFKIGLYKLMKIDEHESWAEAAQFLFEISTAIFSLLGDRENTLTERALKRIIRYIEEHLAEDLPLKTLAEIGGFNASYLSRLFSQTCNQTITEYIYYKRMEKAKKLLAETDEKILSISAATGYISSQSFARAFRNYAGVSPAEYRELCHGQKT